LVSDEGRALIATFGTEDVMIALTNAQAIQSDTAYRRRFYGPEEMESRSLSKERDVWSFGCLCYEAFVPSICMLYT
jgi:serine/threonine protein kinase